MAAASADAERSLPGITMSAPDRKHEYGRPHALAWNIGTTISTRSCSLMANVFAEHWARVWMNVERWL